MTYACSNHQQGLERAFSINVEKDTPDVLPTSFWYACYMVMQRSDKAGLHNISYAWLLNNTTNPGRPGVRCMTSALVCTCCTRGVQENGANGLLVQQSAELLWLIICFAIHFLCVTIEIYHKAWETRGKFYDLSFGMYMLYTWCTREWCNRLGRTPNCRDSMIIHMFRNTFPMRDYWIMPIYEETRGKCYDLSFILYLLYTLCTRE